MLVTPDIRDDGRLRSREAASGPNAASPLLGSNDRFITSGRARLPQDKRVHRIRLDLSVVTERRSAMPRQRRVTGFAQSPTRTERRYVHGRGYRLSVVGCIST